MQITFEDATINQCSETVHFGRLCVMVMIHVGTPQWDSTT